MDPALPGRLSWSDLLIYRQLLDVRSTALAPLETAPVLMHTLETYLDLAGDARRTAARLSLHRTTLYYRLNRIAALLGADLGDGLTRTDLHVALKRRRLARTG